MSADRPPRPDPVEPRELRKASFRGLLLVTMGTNPQLSATVILKVTALAHVLVVALVVMLVEQLMTGSSVSLTVMVKEQVLLLSQASVMTKMFVVIPFGKVAPLARPAVWVSVAAEQESL